jgi:hypothetical protein
MAATLPQSASTGQSPNSIPHPPNDQLLNVGSAEKPRMLKMQQLKTPPSDRRRFRRMRHIAFEREKVFDSFPDFMLPPVSGGMKVGENKRFEIPFSSGAFSLITSL